MSSPLDTSRSASRSSIDVSLGVEARRNANPWSSFVAQLAREGPVRINLMDYLDKPADVAPLVQAVAESGIPCTVQFDLSNPEHSAPMAKALKAPKARIHTLRIHCPGQAVVAVDELIAALKPDPPAESQVTSIHLQYPWVPFIAQPQPNATIQRLFEGLSGTKMEHLHIEAFNDAHLSDALKRLLCGDQLRTLQFTNLTENGVLGLGTTLRAMLPGPAPQSPEERLQYIRCPRLKQLVVGFCKDGSMGDLTSFTSVVFKLVMASPNLHAAILPRPKLALQGTWAVWAMQGMRLCAKNRSTAILLFAAPEPGQPDPGEVDPLPPELDFLDPQYLGPQFVCEKGEVYQRAVFRAFGALTAGYVAGPLAAQLPQWMGIGGDDATRDAKSAAAVNTVTQRAARIGRAAQYVCSILGIAPEPIPSFATLAFSMECGGFWFADQGESSEAIDLLKGMLPNDRLEEAKKTLGALVGRSRPARRDPRDDEVGRGERLLAHARQGGIAEFGRLFKELAARNEKVTFRLNYIRFDVPLLKAIQQVGKPVGLEFRFGDACDITALSHCFPADGSSQVTALNIIQSVRALRLDLVPLAALLSSSSRLAKLVWSASAGSPATDPCALGVVLAGLANAPLRKLIIETAYWKDPDCPHLTALLCRGTLEELRILDILPDSELVPLLRAIALAGPKCKLKKLDLQCQWKPDASAVSGMAALIKAYPTLREVTLTDWRDASGDDSAKGQALELLKDALLSHPGVLAFYLENLDDDSGPEEDENESGISRDSHTSLLEADIDAHLAANRLTWVVEHREEGRAWIVNGFHSPGCFDEVLKLARNGYELDSECRSALSRLDNQEWVGKRLVEYEIARVESGSSQGRGMKRGRSEL